MASWAEIERSEPELARRVRGRFDAYRHKVLATLRKDGSPRISGIEASFDESELWLGMMPGSLKAIDLRRDPRLALHSGTEDPIEGEGMANVVVDAKLSGRAIEVRDPATLRRLRVEEGRAEEGRAVVEGRAAVEGRAVEAHLFRVEVDEVVLISIGDPADHLMIETWDPHRGLRMRKRY